MYDYGDYGSLDGLFEDGLFATKGRRPIKFKKRPDFATRGRIDRTGVSDDTGWYKPVDSLYARCTQDTWWADAKGTTWKLEEMTPIHRSNLIAWLERRAGALHQWAFENGKIAYEDRSLDALEWFVKLPLVNKLMALTYCSACGHKL